MVPNFHDIQPVPESESFLPLHINSCQSIILILVGIKIINTEGIVTSKYNEGTWVWRRTGRDNQATQQLNQEQPSTTSAQPVPQTLKLVQTLLNCLSDVMNQKTIDMYIYFLLFILKVIEKVYSLKTIINKKFVFYMCVIYILAFKITLPC